MLTVSVGSVNKILLMLAQSLYVVLRQTQHTYKHNDFLVTTNSYYYRHFTIIQSRMYVCMSFEYACRLLGNIIVLFPNDCGCLVGYPI